MIEKMTKYSFILLRGEEADFLTKLQELGVVDITRSAKPVDEKSAGMLERIARLEHTATKLERIDFSKDGDFNEVVSRNRILSSDTDATILYPEAFARLKEYSAQLSVAEKEKEYLRHWGNFDAEKLQGLEDLGLKLRYYQVSLNKFDPEWKNQVALYEVTRDKDYIWFVTVSDDPEYSFPVKESPAPGTTPMEKAEDIERLKREIVSAKADLQALKDLVPSVRNEKQELVSELDMYFAEISPEKAAENHVLVFEGFAPEEDDNRLVRAFDELGIFYIKDKARLEDNPPIKLNNNSFTKHFTVITDMFGRPGYNEYDPTPMISIFFLLFFAMCMGDAGYGIIFMILGLFMRKNKDLSSTSPLVMILGAGTFVIGIILHTFFGMDMKEWSFLPDWIRRCMLPAEALGYDAGMVMAIVVGIIHISVAMIVKTYMATKNNGFLNSLGTWGWTLLIVGGVIVGGLSLTKVLDSEVTKWVIIVLGIISAAGIFLFNDIHRNPLVNIGSGLWATYNTASGLLGDVLSYLRLYALGLAGGKLGGAFNMLGDMVLGDGSNPIGWLFCPILLIVGHTINIALCSLGAFVHPLRLNFLEFFKNSGYEGSGRKYKPLEQINN